MKFKNTQFAFLGLLGSLGYSNQSYAGTAGLPQNTFHEISCTTPKHLWSFEPIGTSVEINGTSYITNDPFTDVIGGVQITGLNSFQTSAANSGDGLDVIKEYSNNSPHLTLPLTIPDTRKFAVEFEFELNQNIELSTSNTLRFQLGPIDVRFTPSFIGTKIIGTEGGYTEKIMSTNQREGVYGVKYLLNGKKHHIAVSVDLDANKHQIIIDGEAPIEFKSDLDLNSTFFKNLSYQNITWKIDANSVNGDKIGSFDEIAIYYDEIPDLSTYYHHFQALLSGTNYCNVAPAKCCDATASAGAISPDHYWMFEPTGTEIFKPDGSSYIISSPKIDVITESELSINPIENYSDNLVGKAHNFTLKSGGGQNISFENAFNETDKMAVEFLFTIHKELHYGNRLFLSPSMTIDLSAGRIYIALIDKNNNRIFRTVNLTGKGIHGLDYYKNGGQHHMAIVVDLENDFLKVFVDGLSPCDFQFPLTEDILLKGNTNPQNASSFFSMYHDPRYSSYNAYDILASIDEVAFYYDEIPTDELIKSHYRDVSNGKHYSGFSEISPCDAYQNISELEECNFDLQVEVNLGQRENQLTYEVSVPLQGEDLTYVWRNEDGTVEAIGVNLTATYFEDFGNYSLEVYDENCASSVDFSFDYTNLQNAIPALPKYYWTFDTIGTEIDLGNSHIFTVTDYLKDLFHHVELEITNATHQLTPDKVGNSLTLHTMTGSSQDLKSKAYIEKTDKYAFEFLMKIEQEVNYNKVIFSRLFEFTVKTDELEFVVINGSAKNVFKIPLNGTGIRSFDHYTSESRHIALTIDGETNKLKVYVDGQSPLDFQFDLTLDTPYYKVERELISLIKANRYVLGYNEELFRLDEFAIYYDYIPCANQIAQHYQDVLLGNHYSFYGTGCSNENILPTEISETTSSQVENICQADYAGIEVICPTTRNVTDYGSCNFEVQIKSELIVDQDNITYKLFTNQLPSNLVYIWKNSAGEVLSHGIDQDFYVANTFDVYTLDVFGTDCASTISFDLHGSNFSNVNNMLPKYYWTYEDAGTSIDLGDNITRITTDPLHDLINGNETSNDYFTNSSFLSKEVGNGIVNTSTRLNKTITRYNTPTSETGKFAVEFQVQFQTDYFKSSRILNFYNLFVTISETGLIFRCSSYPIQFITIPFNGTGRNSFQYYKDAMRHFVFMADEINGTAKVYIDGVSLPEMSITFSPRPSTMKRNNLQTSVYDQYIAPVSESFHFDEFAVYYETLPCETTILNHYQNMLDGEHYSYSDADCTGNQGMISTVGSETVESTVQVTSTSTKGNYSINSLEEISTKSIEVYNSIGQRIDHIVLNQINKNKISLELPVSTKTGIYLVKINTSGKSITKKITVM